MKVNLKLNERLKKKKKTVFKQQLRRPSEHPASLGDGLGGRRLGVSGERGCSPELSPAIKLFVP